jgi:hypothetical protein
MGSGGGKIKVLISFVLTVLFVLVKNPGTLVKTGFSGC